MKHDLFDTFITAAAELKFNQLAMHKWQKFSRESEAIPLYSDLLKFLDLEARGAKNTVKSSECRHPVITSGKKPSQDLMQSTSTFVWRVRRTNICYIHVHVRRFRQSHTSVIWAWSREINYA